jgi:hypothetical protein
MLALLNMSFDATHFIGAGVTIVHLIPWALLVIVGSAVTIVATRGTARVRAMWVLGPLAFFELTTTLAAASFHVFTYDETLFVGQLSAVVAVLMPLVLTYVALNRRIIDVGFVLNRTIVFATLSTVVIGAFVLIEGAVGSWIVSVTHVTSSLLVMAVALALGFSLRYLHHYVDDFVDRSFFKKRHDAERALRRFSHEAAYITDTATLVQRTIATVSSNTSASFIDVIARNGSLTYVSPGGNEIGENDPAIVSLRAWHRSVDLHRIEGTEIHGDLAFPMISRGQLIGALICGAKRYGETYAPDESEALQAIAHGVGSALDVLESHRGVQERNVSELADAIAARLREAR